MRKNLESNYVIIEVNLHKLRHKIKVNFTVVFHLSTQNFRLQHARTIMYYDYIYNF